MRKGGTSLPGATREPREADDQNRPPRARGVLESEGKNPSLAACRTSLTLRRPRKNRGTVRDAPRCKIAQRQKPTLNRAWPRELPRAAMCVRNVDDQGVLQFTLIHAVGCVLHRRGSRAIHRLQLFFQLLSLSEIERREASTRPSLGWVAVRKKNGKKNGEESRRSRAFFSSRQGTGLVRASRPGSLPPTDTDSNALAQTILSGATLSYLDSWPA